MNNPIELLQGKNGKLSRTALMFLVWMTFFMTVVGYISFSQKKLTDIPEPYVYITVILCGTYTARQYLDGKLNLSTTSKTTTTTPSLLSSATTISSLVAPVTTISETSITSTDVPKTA